LKENKKKSEKALSLIQTDFVNHFWEKSWTYIKTVVDIVHEPVLILDRSFLQKLSLKVL
jgi:hypothetical protein